MITVTEATAPAGAPRRPSEKDVRARPEGPSRRRTGPGGPRSEAPGAGANRRRPLWASTGVKHPAYRDTLDGNDPVAPDTARTGPGTAPEAAADHGEVTGDTAAGGPPGAAGGLVAVEAPGLSPNEAVTRLEDEDVAEFEAAWQDLLDAVTKSPMSKGVDAE